ncbi:MAG: hypothetical protein WBB28_05970 [Crinalium sp.]
MANLVANLVASSVIILFLIFILIFWWKWVLLLFIGLVIILSLIESGSKAGESETEVQQERESEAFMTTVIEEDLETRLTQLPENPNRTSSRLELKDQADKDLKVNYTENATNSWEIEEPQSGTVKVRYIEKIWEVEGPLAQVKDFFNTKIKKISPEK